MIFSDLLAAISTDNIETLITIAFVIVTMIIVGLYKFVRFLLLKLFGIELPDIKLPSLKREPSTLEKMGFFPSGVDLYGIGRKCSSWGILKEGNNRKLTNFHHGMHKDDVVCFFTYKYEEEKHSDDKIVFSKSYECMLVVSSKIDLPFFMSFNEDYFAPRASEVSGLDTIDLEYNQFNERFTLLSPDKRRTYLFFGRDMMNHMLEFENNITMEAEKNYFLFKLPGSGLSKEQYEEYLEFGTGLYEYLDPIAREDFPYAGREVKLRHLGSRKTNNLEDKSSNHVRRSVIDRYAEEIEEEQRWQN